MTTLKPIDSAIDRAEKLLREGKIEQGLWGRCPLSAMFPKCGEKHTASACPPDALWPWLAHAVPWMTDNTSEKEWRGYAKRFYAVARNLHRLPANAGRRIRLRWQHEHILPMARAACPHDATKCLAAIDRVIKLHDRELRGEAVTEEEWSAAKEAAWSAAAWAAAASAAWSAAAWAAAVSAAAARESWSYSSSSAKAEEEASDTLVEGLLSILEEEIAKVMR